MALCSFEGPEGGIGDPLGKKPRKLWSLDKEFWDLGFITLKTWVCLEQLVGPIMMNNSSTTSSSTIWIWSLFAISISKMEAVLEEEKRNKKKREGYDMIWYDEKRNKVYHNL